MIADRYVLVVRQERVVGPELTADIHCVMNAGVEIRVIADFRRQMQCACRCVVHVRLDLGTMRFVAQERRQRAAQAGSHRGLEREHLVQPAARERRRDLARQKPSDGRQVQNSVADRDTGARLLARA